jgi:hypothetical protein
MGLMEVTGKKEHSIKLNINKAKHFLQSDQAKFIALLSSFKTTKHNRILAEFEYKR